MTGVEKAADQAAPKASLISLGCAKNLVDSEVLAHQLTALGYRLSGNPGEAALIVVNTCGFLESAVEEAIETLLDVSRFKKNGSCRHLAAVGCMVQRYGKKLVDLLPEVDFFAGTSQYAEFASLFREFLEDGRRRLHLRRSTYLLTAETPKERATARHTAYVKIAEGCSNRCSFCLIPKLRGPFRSRTVGDVVREISSLAEAGTVEVNLIAQDITAFGSDRNDSAGLIRLIEAIEAVAGIRWVRLLYAHPQRITADLLKTMNASRKVVPYLDVPFQHSAPGILQAMHRSGGCKSVEQVVELIRSELPEATLRTSLMVGFPGETRKEFKALCAFVERAQFDHVGVFVFSPEKGSLAARFPGRVSRRTAERRRSDLMELQRAISRRRLRRWVGRRVPVLVEGVHPETDLLLVGRTAHQAPEVDGSVLITGGTAEVGRILDITITGSHDYDLEGFVAEATDERGEAAENPSAARL